MGKTRSRQASAGLTLDAGALISIDRGDQRLLALLELALDEAVPIRVPSGVVGQAWRGDRQANLARFLKAREVWVLPLDEQLARAAGELCGATRTADVIDASVVLTARATRDVVLSSDVNDLLRLDPDLHVERV